MTEHEKKQREARRKAQQVALFRYQLICPALDPGLTTKARGRIVRGIAAAEHDHPFAGKVRYGRDSLDRWIRRYRADGFDALVPSTHRPGLRTDLETLEMAAALKRENPGRTAAQIGRILSVSTGWSPSESTLLRHFHRLELMGPAAGQATEVFGRFEAAAANERWAGDALHGPRLGGRKVYLFAFIDDHSRLVTGYRFGFAEDTVRLSAALDDALKSRGAPETLYVDNGSAYVDAWLLRACGKLGIRLVHATPHRPQGKGKIERFFRTVREQFLIEVAETTAEQLATTGQDHAAALLELNRRFDAWVETVYHHAVHSETEQSPLARWNDSWSRAGHVPAIPDAPTITEAFKWSEYRSVTKTATVSLHGNTYQVEPALCGRRVELVFSPFNLATIEVRYGGKPFGPAVPHVITRHAHPKARPETPAAPPPKTGIDYLALVADAHEQQLAVDPLIGYHALYARRDDAQPAEQLSIDELIAETGSGINEEGAGA